MRISNTFVCALFLFAASFPARAAEVVGVWELVNSASNSAVDKCHGQLVGEGGYSNSVLRLNGGYVDFGSDSSLSVTSSLSYCVWLKAEEQNRIQRICGRFEQGGEGNNREFCSFITADGRTWAFLSEDGCAGERSVLRTTAQPAVTNGEWTHVAVTWDAEKGAEGLLIYVDGLPVPLLTAQGPNIRSLQTGNASLTLGAYDTGSQESGILTNTFIGAMSDFRLFRGVLTEDEIAAICDASQPAGVNPTPAIPTSGLPKSSITSSATGSSQLSSSSLAEPAGTNLVSGSEAGTNGVIIVPGVPDGRTIYVDRKTGDDALSGKAPVVVGADGPKRTIKAGLSAAGSGDTLIIREGHYGEDLNIAGRNISVRIEGNVNLCGKVLAEPQAPIPSTPTNSIPTGVSTNLVK